MSRYNETLTNKAYGAGAIDGTINLGVDGQNGYLTDMAYAPSATDYVRKPVRAKVLRVPSGLLRMPNAPMYVRAYKNLMETWMTNWAGLNRTLVVSSAETQIGNASEVFHTPTRVTRNRSNITSTVTEKARRPIIRFLEDITRFTIGDPDVIHPLLTGYDSTYRDNLSDTYGATILFYETDGTFNFVENSILVTNFYINQDVGENLMNKNLQADGETVTYNLNWTGWQKVGPAVDRLAQSFIDANRVTGIDPGFQRPFIEGVDANVAAINTGFDQQIQTLKRTMVSP